jgi:hypothetical protein
VRGDSGLCPEIKTGLCVLYSREEEGICSVLDDQYVIHNKDCHPVRPVLLTSWDQCFLEEGELFQTLILGSVE